MNKLESVISVLNEVAMGSKKADLVLTECTLLNVYTGETTPNTQVAIIRGRIAYVGNNASHTIGDKTQKMNLHGMSITPGFADPHVHIDQFVLPSELAKQSLIHGTTSLFSDPIDITSVGGYEGFCEFLRLCEDLPIRIFNVVPGGLPVDPKFSHSHSLNTKQTRSAIKNDSVLGLGEVFSWTKVTMRDPKTMADLSAMLEADCIINGHTAGASEKKLNAYVASGILSCHEPINFDQVLERLRLGMSVMIREGSIRRDLKEIIPRILQHKTYTNRLMFCSDGLDPHDIQRFGHIDHCVREAISLGVKPIDAISMASKNCFDYYHMEKDLGGIAPGKLADILVFDDLKNKPKMVFVGGRLIVNDGKILAKIKSKKILPKLLKTVRIKKLSPKDFVVRSKESKVMVNTITMLTEIITKLGEAELATRDQNVQASLDQDVYKVAAFDRTGRTQKRAIGFLSNFGAELGAFASTWSFHENDLIVIGSDDSDMASAANHLIKSQGGMVLVSDGKVKASLRLPFGGIISTDSFDTVSENFGKINDLIVDSGSKFAHPHMMPLFLPFLALPSVRILANGIIDVKNRTLVNPIKV